jgi:phage terminase large subunit
MIIRPLYEPRSYQQPFLQFMLQPDPGKRAVLVWHRRAGKDLTALNWTFVGSQQRVGAYYMLYPTYAQGRKILWNGFDGAGKRFIHYIPQSLVERDHETDMRLHLTNGSILQVVGADRMDRIVGPNPIGLVLSEYALQDRRAWQYMSPILAENQGWAVFIYTPRGRNHGYDLWLTAQQMALQYPARWFAELLTVEDTGAIPLSVLEDERAAGMPEELIRQEYYCDFLVSLAGSFFGSDIERAEEEGRITDVPYDPSFPVHTAWDFGLDTTAIWFLQTNGHRVTSIDFYENASRGLEHYAQVLRDKRYTYGTHLAPHDMASRDWVSERSRRETAANLGIDFIVMRRTPVEDQVNATHLLIPRCTFDRVKCVRGIDALREFRREWDEDNQVYKRTYVHDWASHPASAFMTLAIGVDYLDNNRSPRSEYAEGWIEGDYATGDILSYL